MVKNIEKWEDVFVHGDACLPNMIIHEEQFSGTSILEAFKKFKKYIKNIHISDFDKGIEHKVLGEGSLPLKDFIVQLKKENYDGILTIELDFDNKKRNNILNNEHAISAIQKSIDFIKDSIK